MHLKDWHPFGPKLNSRGSSAEYGTQAPGAEPEVYVLGPHPPTVASIFSSVRCHHEQGRLSIEA